MEADARLDQPVAWMSRFGGAESVYCVTCRPEPFDMETALTLRDATLSHKSCGGCGTDFKPVLLASAPGHRGVDSVLELWADRVLVFSRHGDIARVVGYRLKLARWNFLLLQTAPADAARCLEQCPRLKRASWGAEGGDTGTLYLDTEAKRPAPPAKKSSGRRR